MFEGIFGFGINRKLLSTIGYFLRFFLLACELCKSGLEIIHCASGTVRNMSIAFMGLYTDIFKASVRYFLTNFYLSPNDSPSKTMTDAFYFI